MVTSSEHRSCHLSLEQWADIFLDTCWLGILLKKTGISLYISSIWAPIPYKVLLLDLLTYFQQRHIYLRSRHSLKISQRQPWSFGVFRRLWKWFSWISSGWSGIWKRSPSGCSTHSWSPAPMALLLSQRLSEGRPAAELFALLGVLVSSGPNCIFHIFSEMSLGSSYLLQNYIHLYVIHLQ